MLQRRPTQSRDCWPEKLSEPAHLKPRLIPARLGSEASDCPLSCKTIMKAEKSPDMKSIGRIRFRFQASPCRTCQKLRRNTGLAARTSESSRSQDKTYRHLGTKLHCSRKASNRHYTRSQVDKDRCQAEEVSTPSWPEQ